MGRCHGYSRWSDFKGTDRFQGIKEAMNDLETMPPIEVYKVDDEYYVVDGHHRVMAGRDIGRDFIDAEIIEYRFSGEKKDKDCGECPMKEFRQRTGLKGVILNSRDRYEKLTAHIRDFGSRLGRGLSLKEVAQKWYRSEFLPFIRENSDPGDKCTEAERYCREKLNGEEGQIENLTGS